MASRGQKNYLGKGRVDPGVRGDTPMKPGKSEPVTPGLPWGRGGFGQPAVTPSTTLPFPGSFSGRGKGQPSRGGTGPGKGPGGQRKGGERGRWTNFWSPLDERGTRKGQGRNAAPGQKEGCLGAHRGSRGWRRGCGLLQLWSLAGGLSRRPGSPPTSVGGAGDRGVSDRGRPTPGQLGRRRCRRRRLPVHPVPLTPRVGSKRCRPTPGHGPHH